MGQTNHNFSTLSQFWQKIKTQECDNTAILGLQLVWKMTSLICCNIQRLMIRQHQMLTHHVMVDGLMNLLIFLHQM